MKNRTIILALVTTCAVAGAFLNAQERVSKAKANCPQLPIVKETCESVMTPIAWMGGIGDGALTGAKIGVVLGLSVVGYRLAHKHFKITEILCSVAITGGSIYVLQAELGGNLAGAFPLPNFSSSAIAPTATTSGYSGDAMSLFSRMDSVGVIAIGHAEGNMTVNGDRTALYDGHTDPGNFVKNQGWCSDQGRGGGDVNKADLACMKRTTDKLGSLYAALKEVGIDPDQNLEVAINSADLYNQASPWVVENFPSAYRAQIEAGFSGTEAIARARTASFSRTPLNVPGLDTSSVVLDAKGLLGICSRENRGLSHWDCVYHDQNRRVQAIAAVLKENKQQPSGNRAIAPSQGYIHPITLGPGVSVSQGFSMFHQGIDYAAPMGTPVLAAAGGTVNYAGDTTNGLGLTVSVVHPNGDRTIYGHNSKLLVKNGDEVQQGQAIAEVGSTGNSTGPHVHFELETTINGSRQFVDPSPHLP